MIKSDLTPFSKKTYRIKLPDPNTYPIEYGNQILLAIQKDPAYQEQIYAIESDCVMRDPLLLEFVSDATKGNVELISALIQKNAAVFSYILPELQLNADFLLLAVRSGYLKLNLIIEGGPEYGGGTESYVAAVNKTDENICKHPELVAALLPTDAYDLFNRCAHYLISDVAIVHLALSFDPRIIKFLPETFPNYRETLRSILEANFKIYHALYEHIKPASRPVIDAVVLDLISYEEFATEVPRNEILSVPDIGILYFAKFPHLLLHAPKNIIQNRRYIHSMLLINGYVILHYLALFPNERNGDLAKYAIMAHPDNEILFAELPLVYQEYLSRNNITGPLIRSLKDTASTNYLVYNDLPDLFKEILKAQGFTPPPKPQPLAPTPTPTPTPSASASARYFTQNQIDRHELSSATAEQRNNLFYVLAYVRKDMHNFRLASSEMQNHPLIAYSFLKITPYSFDCLKSTQLSKDMLKEKSVPFLSGLTSKERLDWLHQRIDPELLPLLDKTDDELIVLSQTAVHASAVVL